MTYSYVENLVQRLLLGGDTTNESYFYSSTKKSSKVLRECSVGWGRGRRIREEESKGHPGYQTSVVQNLEVYTENNGYGHL